MSEQPTIELVPATADQQPILANLLELYAHDFSEFHDIDPGPDGRFGYKDLPLYWRDPDRHPFLVHADGALAGFVLVKRVPPTPGSQPIWDMAEFFILRRYRRRGIGTRTAHEVWKRLPGPWQVRVMQSNQAGGAFWERAIVTFADKQIPGQPSRAVTLREIAAPWRIFSFVSNG